MRKLLIVLAFFVAAVPAQAQTRFYFPSTGAAPVSPAFGSWGDTTNAIRRELVTTRISSVMTTIPAADAANTTTDLHIQYVKCGLEAQTIDGTVKGQVRAAESHSAANAKLALRVAKSASDGTSVTEILAISLNGAGTTPPVFVIEPTAATNRAFETNAGANSLTLTSTTINAGDCLIIEIGSSDDSANTARFGKVVIGDNNATDLPEDETTTAENNPWIEFTDTITFAAAGGSGAPQQNRLLIRQ